LKRKDQTKKSWSFSIWLRWNADIRLSVGDPDNAEDVINALGTVLELRELAGLRWP
jgi:hypothetical protein